MDDAAAFRDPALTTGLQREPGRRRSGADGRSEWSLTAFDIMRRNLPVLAPGPLTLRAAGPQSSRGIGIAAGAAQTRARSDDFTRLDPASFDWVNYGGKSSILVTAISAKFRASRAFTLVWPADPGLQFVGKSWYGQASSAKRGSFAPVNARLDRQAGDSATLSCRVTNFLDKSYAACI